MKRKAFGERNFGHAELGDVRRTRRLVDLADCMAHRPSGTLPEKNNSPKDLKAMYRLFDADDVTHDAILESHQEHLFTDVIPAVTLLNLRDDSRKEETKDLPATDYIDAEYIEVLSMWRHGKPRLDWTVSDFVLALARMSGHQNRRGAHPPSWQKLWKGWHELHGMLAGARIAKKLKTCG